MLPHNVWTTLHENGAVSPSDAATVDAFAEGGAVELVRLESWAMRSMWGAVR